MSKPNFPPLEKDYGQVLAPIQRSVVFFWAEWSPSDLMLLQVLDHVAPEFNAHFAFFVAELDDEGVWPLAVETAIATTPTLVLFQYGQESAHSVGFVTEAALRQKLSEWLALS